MIVDTIRGLAATLMTSFGIGFRFPESNAMTF
jgi:hypothetical protein